MRKHTLVIVAALFAACAPQDGYEDEDIALESGSVTTVNALSANALTTNALTSNAITMNALTSNALTSNALTSNALAMTALADASARQFFSYAVSCALPSGSSVSLTIGGVPYTFPGALALAPQWGNAGGTCNLSCQRWVSACMIARVNANGISVPISLRGSASTLTASAAETTRYSQPEGRFFGNVLASPQEIYSCYENDSSWEPYTNRKCADGGAGCPTTVIGPCSSQTWDVWGQGFCTVGPICGPAGCVGGTGAIWAEVVSVYLDDPCLTDDGSWTGVCPAQYPSYTCGDTTMM